MKIKKRSPYIAATKMRYYVEFETVDWKESADDEVEEIKNVYLYVNAWSADQIRDMFAEYNLVAVDQTDQKGE